MTLGDRLGATLESSFSGGANRNSSGSTLADSGGLSGELGSLVVACVFAFGLVACRFSGDGALLGLLDSLSASHSSSSFLVSTIPGTRIGDEHLGQTSFCPARLAGAFSFFWHFGHAKFNKFGFASDKAWPRVLLALAVG